jgi:hypothetical protein
MHPQPLRLNIIGEVFHIYKIFRGLSADRNAETALLLKTIINNHGFGEGAKRWRARDDGDRFILRALTDA